MNAEPTSDSRKKLLDAGLKVIRQKGYSATRVDDICETAGLTKGGFFHHFKGKEDFAVAAAGHWSAMTGGFFAEAPYHALPDPLDRVLGYIDFRRDILRGSLSEFTCLVGTMVQEAYDSNPAIRAACDASISGHAAEVEKDIAAARKLYAPDARWTAASLALYTQAVIQGAFILAKAKQGPDIAADCLDHLKRYVELLFDRDSNRENTR
jgi:TetR/AcrR family transcriptional regulator, transcriptional repressor for nem operon